MNTAKLTLYRWRSADGGQAQPDDTVEVEVGVVAWDLDNDAETEAVWIDASLLGEDLGRRSDGSRRTWTVADVMHRFRPNRFAVAYGDLYVDDRERPLIDMDPELTASIEAHGTDCRDPADYLSAQADVT